MCVRGLERNISFRPVTGSLGYFFPVAGLCVAERS